MSGWTGKKKILLLIFLLTLAFIWGNSMIPADTSSEESGWVMKIAEPILEIFVGKGNVTDHLVRKLAHFAEYALLGAELCGLFDAASLKGILYGGTHGLLAALVDETIQLFSAGRSCQVTDVWLDFSGVLTGAVILYFGLKLFLGRNHEKK